MLVRSDEQDIDLKSIEGAVILEMEEGKKPESSDKKEIVEASNPFNMLPDELLLNILDLLPPENLARIAQVGKRFWQISAQPMARFKEQYEKEILFKATKTARDALIVINDKLTALYDGIQQDTQRLANSYHVPCGNFDKTVINVSLALAAALSITTGVVMTLATDFYGLDNSLSTALGVATGVSFFASVSAIGMFGARGRTVNTANALAVKNTQVTDLLREESIIKTGMNNR